MLTTAKYYSFESVYLCKAHYQEAFKSKRNKPFYQDSYKFAAISPFNCTYQTIGKYKKIDVPQARVFELENFFSQEECAYYIKEAEKAGFESLSAEFPEEYRNNQRLLVKNQALSEKIYARLMQYYPLCKEDLKYVKPFGSDTEGVWVPHGIGQVAKFSKYKQGSKFLPHIDNLVEVDPDEKSIFTLIIYLNDNFDSGKTYFHKREKKMLPFIPQNLKKTRVASVTPKTGTCLLFNHDVLHEGERVDNGEKYIIRVELMYKRISKTHSRIFETGSKDVRVMQTFQLYAEADELIMQGDTVKATEKYLEALSLFTALSPSVSSGLNGLPSEMILLIFSFLDYGDVFRLARVNKMFNYFHTDDAIWNRLIMKHALGNKASLQHDMISGIKYSSPYEKFITKIKRELNIYRSIVYLLFNGKTVRKVCPDRKTDHVVPFVAYQFTATYYGMHSSYRSNGTTYGESPLTLLKDFTDPVLLSTINLYNDPHALTKNFKRNVLNFSSNGDVNITTSNIYSATSNTMVYEHNYKMAMQVDRVEAEIAGAKLCHALFIHATIDDPLFVSVVNGTIWKRGKEASKVIHGLEPSLQEKMLRNVVFSELSENISDFQKFYPHGKQLENVTLNGLKKAIDHPTVKKWMGYGKSLQKLDSS